MERRFMKEAIGWGVGLWLIGYVLGFVLFFIVPANLIGWIITPIGTIITMWVLFKKISGDSIQYYVKIGVAWLIIALVCDYLFLVKLLNPTDGYYKPDVYLYYALTLILPIAIGAYKLTTLRKAD